MIRPLDNDFLLLFYSVRLDEEVPTVLECLSGAEAPLAALEVFFLIILF